ncbi:MAG: serine/threonine-protein kinase [Polyangiaceae bacterium]
MLRLPPEDDQLRSLEGLVVRSGAQPDAAYRLDRAIGAGSYAVAFLALRIAAGGESPAVIKVVRPSLMRRSTEMAQLTAHKEIVALSRLNERVPPTPFVVRLLDHDYIDVDQAGLHFRLPWLALEYVHGGAEGTTLEERIDFSVEQTGYAFDPDRAALAITCLANGLEAIHEVGVMHRDLSPHNVLCCGFGNGEIFKIADFGIARPFGDVGTFVGLPGGTPGYTAPEQVRRGGAPAGTESDIFSLAAITFKILTGEELFQAKSTVDTALLAHEQKRRRITDSKGLCPELRERTAECTIIDRILARATAPDPRHRPPTAWEMAAGVLRALRPRQRRSRPPRRRLESITDYSAPRRFGWSWHVRHQPGEQRVLRSVAWDGDGRCLAAASRGLTFWNGTTWIDAPIRGFPHPYGVRFAERVDAGLYWVGGDGATIAHYSPEGFSSILRAEDGSVSFTHASGELEDLAVLVGERQGEAPLLFALTARRWMKPAKLSRARRVTAIARLEDERWLISGKSTSGSGFAAIYTPLMIEVERLSSDDAEVYTCCAAQPDLALGAVVGTGGNVLLVESGTPKTMALGDASDLHAVAIDPTGRVVAGGVGELWLYDAIQSDPWSCVWRDPSWKAPFLSVFADVGRIVATTVDGGIVEGRWEPATGTSP